MTDSQCTLTYPHVAFLIWIKLLPHPHHDITCETLNEYPNLLSPSYTQVKSTQWTFFHHLYWILCVLISPTMSLAARNQHATDYILLPACYFFLWWWGSNSHMLGKHSTNDLHPSPWIYFSFTCLSPVSQYLQTDTDTW